VTDASHTEREILSQPEIWERTLATLSTDEASAYWGQMEPRGVLVTGCGSTFYLALTAASLIRDEVGLQSRAMPASEIALSSRAIPEIEGSFLLAISRSGTTSETLAAVARFRELGGAGVIVVTNYPDAELSSMADVVLCAPAGQEESVAQTRSFSSMLLTVEALVGQVAGLDRTPMSRLPELGASLLMEAQEPMRSLATDSSIERFYFLGSDPLYGVAAEGMLKLKEMSLTDSEAFHSLEFRHGPIAMADPTAAVIGLIAPDRRQAELAVVNDAAGLGARTISVGSGASLPIDDDIPSWVRPVLYLLPLQTLALERARFKGLNPDRPRNLVAVIELDSLGNVPTSE